MLFDAVITEKVAVYTKMLKGLKVDIPKDAKELTGKPLLKRIMQTWLPAADALLLMIVNHLPSPKVAQKYRVGNLYSGPMDDEAAMGIAACDKDGELMMYISRWSPLLKRVAFMPLVVCSPVPLPLVKKSVFKVPTTFPAPKKICSSRKSNVLYL